MTRRKGFTLIELLVVISIIALLMAILMPALSRAKKQAMSAACQMNLHQWGVIWSMYCDDNDTYFCEVGALGWDRGEWVVALRSQYDTKRGLLVCPMAAKPRPDGGAWGGPFNTFPMGAGGTEDRQEEGSYGVNCWVYNTPPGGKSVLEVQGCPAKYNWRTKNVAGGSRIPVFADAMWRGGCPFETGLKGDPPEFDGQWLGYEREMRHFCMNRHNGFINQLFMDWSVRKVGLKELWVLKWHREFSTSGPWTRAGGCAPSDWPQWMAGFKDY